MRTFVILGMGIACSAWAGTGPGDQLGNTPTIDGRIQEDEWVGAKILDQHYVTVPRIAEKPDITVVLIKQSKTSIYVAFKCWPRGKVIRQSLIRSSDEEKEFFILLDLENKN